VPKCAKGYSSTVSGQFYKSLPQSPKLTCPPPFVSLDFKLLSTLQWNKSQRTDRTFRMTWD